MDTWGLRRGWAAPQLSPRQGGPGARVLGLGGLACSVGRRSLSSPCSPLLLWHARTHTRVCHSAPPVCSSAGPSSVPAFRAGPPGNRPAARRAARSHCFPSCADGRGVSPDENAKREDLDVPASEASGSWRAGPARAAFPAVLGASPWGSLRRCLGQLPALELASFGIIEFAFRVCVLQTKPVSCTYMPKKNGV